MYPIKKKTTTDANTPSFDGEKKGFFEGSLENSFEREYARRQEMYQKIERIEIAVAHLRKRYEKYEDLTRFVEYLGATEKMFLEMRFKPESLEELKESLIQGDMYRFSQEIGVKEEMLTSIYEEFQASQSGVASIMEIAEKLLSRHKDCEECRHFIMYIRDIYIVLINHHEKALSEDEFRERIIQAKMQSMSSDGSPELNELERIYDEFRKDLHGVAI